MLRRQDYVGRYVWNKTRKRNEWGEVEQRRRPETEWQRTAIPEWRIVSDDLWQRVQERLIDAAEMACRFSNGKLVGRPRKRMVTNLLANLATCVCGGGLVVETYKTNTGKPRRSHDVCNRRRANGKCANNLRIPMEAMHESVFAAVEEICLTPEAVEQVVLLSERAHQDDAQERLQRELKDVDQRISRLVAAIEGGADVPSVQARLREQEQRRATLAEELLAVRPVPRLAPEVIEGRLSEWRRLLRASTTQGRMVLDRVLAGRIVFTPTGDSGYAFEAPTRYDKLFSGPRPSFIDGDAGTEDIGAEDTPDADYGRLLERAVRSVVSRTRVASPPGFVPARVERSERRRA